MNRSPSVGCRRRGAARRAHNTSIRQTRAPSRDTQLAGVTAHDTGHTPPSTHRIALVLTVARCGARASPAPCAAAPHSPRVSRCGALDRGDVPSVTSCLMTRSDTIRSGVLGRDTAKLWRKLWGVGITHMGYDARTRVMDSCCMPPGVLRWMRSPRVPAQEACARSLKANAR